MTAHRAVAIALVVVSTSLALPAPSGAHLVPEPSFVESGSTTWVALTGPNERDEVMTGLRLRPPSGVTIVTVHDHAGWTEEIAGGTAVWSDGSLAPGAEETLHVELAVSADPGPLSLEAEQLYPDGAAVRWDVPLTVVPAAEGDSSRDVLWALAVAGAFLVVTAVIVLVAWRRRDPVQDAG